MFNTMRITGESLAVAATAAVLISVTAARTSSTQAVAAIQGQKVSATTGQAFADALHLVFIGLGGLALVGAILTAWALRPSHDTEADEARAGMR
jgi:hypothetical protein